MKSLTAILIFSMIWFTVNVIIGIHVGGRIHNPNTIPIFFLYGIVLYVIVLLIVKSRRR